MYSFCVTNVQSLIIITHFKNLSLIGSFLRTCFIQKRNQSTRFRGQSKKNSRVSLLFNLSLSLNLFDLCSLEEGGEVTCTHLLESSRLWSFFLLAKDPLGRTDECITTMKNQFTVASFSDIRRRNWSALFLLERTTNQIT